MLRKSTNFQIRKLMCSLMLLSLPFLMTAQTSSGQLWTPIEESEIPQVGKRYIIPVKYQTLKLDVDKMRAALAKAPMTKTAAVKEKPAYVEIPWPDGSIKTFQIIEAPVMEAELAAKYPEIKTYKGSEVGDPSKYIRLDLTPQGFHAIVLTAGEGTVYVDPYTFGGGDIKHYLSYYKSDFSPIEGKTMVCGVRGNPIDAGDFRPTGSAGSRFGGCELRTYRLALAATGEYTQFHGGTVALALAAQNTSMNRVNAVYNRDMAIQMNIIANNNLIIYTNGATDPYTNNNGGTMLNENQTNVDAVIGAANYDIGHVFSTGGGGIAQLYSPCSNNKARGVTGSGAPVNDPFDIDYVCHEIGHQFGGNHTQNNNCQRSAASVEPGSASTIMGYAGICAPNVQNNSDDHFNGINLEEIDAFITSAGHTCPVKTPLSNNAPTITSTNGGGVTVPGSTPFMLTAIATDPDANTLTYCWEQQDAAVATMPPVATSTDGPNFRSNSPITSGTRHFPNLPAVIAGTNPTWEVLSSVTRTMDFRVTVRDNAPGGGCTDHADVTVSIDGNSGPFIVNYPSATGITWAGLTTETVTWTVAGTDVAPVACANVDILLSTDGGLTYPTVLANNVPNDGSQSVTVPNVGTTTARIMVVCANGTFFDISDNNFTITVATNDYTLAATPDTASACQPANAVYTVTIGQVGSYSNPVTLSVTGVPAGASSSFGTNPVGTPGTTTLTISNTGAAAPGVYNLTLTGNSASGTKNYPLVLNITGSPGAVTLTTPANGATGVAVPTTFNWTGSGTPGEQYDIDIATDPGFASIVDNATGLASPTYVSAALSPGTNYFWRVRGTTACGNGPFSTTFSFTTNTCATYTSTNVPVVISASGTPTVTSNLNIPITGTITDVNVLNLAGTHTFINDLVISLTSPATTNVELWNRICNNENDFDINMDDGAPAGALPCPPVGGGTFQPSGSLANFNGQNPNGNWVLTISDAVNQDGGQLNSWALEVCVTPPVTCAVSTAQTNVSCNGGNDGTATATATGTAPFTFAWTGGQTNATATALTAGVYTVTMTDGAACSSLSTVTITEPSAITSAPTQTSETCAGNDGTATANGAGGSAPLTYLWSNGQTNNTATALAAGTFNYTITDANACVLTGSIAVVDGCVPCTMTAAAVTDNNVSCNGGNDGQATVTQTGGIAPITFAWNNGQTNATATALAAGTYTVTVTDNNACTATATATITEPTAITSAPSATAESCAGNDGSATANGTGGTAPLSYLWSNGQTNNTATALALGNFNYTITDANGCTETGLINVPTSCLTGCDTVSNINFATDTIRFYTAAAGPPTQYVAGHNQYGDIGKYDYYNYGGANSHIQGTYLGFGTAVASNATNTFNVVVRDGTGATPGAIIATVPVTYQEVVDSLNAGNSVLYVPFGTVLMPVSSEFFVGIEFAYGSDTIALLSNTIGETTPNTAWEQWGDLTFHPYSDPAGWNFDLAHFIIPVLGTDPTAGFSQSTAALCEGSTVTFTNTSTLAQDYEWSFPGGTPATSTAVNPVVTYNTAGTYDVTLIAINDCMADTISMTNAVTVNSVGVSVTSTNVSCNGGNDGTATATPVGGAAAFSFSWTGGQTNATATALTAGSYTVTLTDGNGCEATATATITEPTALSAAAAVTSNYNGSDISCNGASDGTASVTSTGGTGAVSFVWSNSQTGANATNLGAGSHSVTATDANGCTAVASVTVVAPTAVTGSTSSTSESCAGNDGTATAIGSGGTGAYTFQWNAAAGSQNTATAVGLTAGSYDVTITDANGCPTVSSATVADGCVCTMTAAAVTDNNVSCNGGNDGQATATQVGGTAPITFLWNNGQTNAIATGLVAGTYTITVTDNNACTATATATITEPTALSAAAAVTSNYNGSDISCNGASDGTASVTSTGGTGAVSFVWSNAQTGANATNLGAGSHSVTATDANGCTAVASVTVVAPTTVTGSTSSTSESCAGNDGTATAIGSGGTGAYTFQWNAAAGSQNTATAVGLTAGSYDVTITDANGCPTVSSATVVDGCSCPMTAAAVTDNNVSCNGGNDGQATATQVGGTAPITFLWNNGQTNATATGLVAGTYTITVTDNNACTASATATITEPTALNTVAAVTSNYNGSDISCNGASDGTASVTSTGGTGAVSFVWSNSQTGANATNLTAGTYMVTATDANGCMDITSVVLTEPTAVSVAVAQASPILCNGGATGACVATPNGGTAPYIYQWDVTTGSQTSQTATGLSAGFSCVTITDANGCTATNCGTLTEPTAITASTSSTDESCAGNDGTATVSAAGGTPGYSFQWNAAAGNQVTATAIALAAGTYDVTVTDANGCILITSATVNDGCSCIMTAAAVTDNNVSCNGASDGQATATQVGGAAPISFVWNNGQTNATATALSGGTYTVTVTDNNGCTATATATITEPTAISVATTQTNVACNGGSDGTATATATGGVGGFTFSWSNGQTNATATGLIAGTYMVTATDANACTGTTSVTITQPNSALSSLVTGVQNPSCNGDSDGSITVNAFGGTPSYTFDIGAGAQASGTFTGLSGGSYTITVTDANGCTSTAATGLVNPPLVNASATVSTAVSCAGNADGSATATAFGGSGGFTFTWSDGQTAGTATGLLAGAYTVTATDVNGCIGTASVTLTDPSGVTATASAGTPISCAGGSDGTATASGSGGAGGFTFVWSNGQSTATATGLGAGTHAVTVSDANGCFDVSSVVLSDPAGMTSSAFVTSNFNGEDVSCNGASDATAFANVVGGASPYTFLWSPTGQTDQTATGLSAGAYTVVITDAGGCTSVANVTVTEPSAVTAGITDNGDGTATANATGGTPSYAYQWDATAGSQTTQTATGLIHNGTYTVTITDANGCTTVANVTVVINGLDEIPNLSLFDVVPNPSTGEFTIRVAFTEAKDATVKLTNVLGQVLREYNYSDIEYQIPVDIQHQASGVYFVTLQTNNQSVTRKVIIAK